MRFLFAFIYSTLITFLVLILTIWIRSESNSVFDNLAFILLYQGLFSFIGCLLGEIILWIITKFNKRLVLLEFIIFLVLGMVMGQVMTYWFSTDTTDMIYRFYSVIGALSFYMGRNFLKNEWLER
jgi:hypothetical protein